MKSLKRPSRSTQSARWVASLALCPSGASRAADLVQPAQLLLCCWRGLHGLWGSQARGFGGGRGLSRAAQPGSQRRRRRRRRRARRR